MSLYDPAELKAIEDNHNARLHTDEAYRLCSTIGTTDDQLAKLWSIDLQTLLDWKLACNGFLDAIESGRAVAPYDPVSSLYRAATGYTVQVIDKQSANGHRTQQVLPNTKACAFWLKHRQPEHWGA